MVDKTATTATKPPPTSIETELEAMQEMLAALKKLDRESQQRVMRYLRDRLDLYLGGE